jgi:Co/Zn/Cd efflux system component
MPAAAVMSGVGLMALAANGIVLACLWRRRDDDLNMRSAWLCSRNDVVANVGVVAAAGGVAVTGSPWPDIVAGGVIALLFCTSAVEVLRDAGRQLRPRPAP